MSSLALVGLASFGQSAARAQARISVPTTLTCTATTNPPLATAGQTITLTASCTGGFGRITFTWRDANGNVVGTGAVVTVVAPTSGPQSFTLSAADDANATKTV